MTMAVLWISRLLALLGFVDATYLTMSHYAGTGLACGPGGGCDIVTTSRFATVAGVPIAAIGTAYYVIVNMLVWTRTASLPPAAAGGLLVVTASASVVSGVLVILQAAVIHAWCRFCLLSAVITIGLFTCALILYRSARINDISKEEPMRSRRWKWLVLAAISASNPAILPAQERLAPGWVLAIHGGAGTIRREATSPDEERAIRNAMDEALQAGAAVLDRGGASLDAVEAAIRILEDSPRFNAGRGAVFTHSGANELDASIMDGATGRAGAVAGVRHVKNPVSLARLVMEESPHVMLAREGAEEFALEHGVQLVPASYFHTESAWQSLQRALERERGGETGSSGPGSLERDREAMGTVGAVALDRSGNLAAGTSTGGMTNKLWGRIGDSPIIGAGTYADNEMGCAISATGHGEFFIRNVVAYDICARKHYTRIPLRDAADQVIMEVLVAQDAEGGVIALDQDGSVAMPFNTTGMYRGHVAAGREPVIEIFRE